VALRRYFWQKVTHSVVVWEPQSNLVLFRVFDSARGAARPTDGPPNAAPRLSSHPRC